MFGLGPVEFVVVAIMAGALLTPVVAAVVILSLAATGRLGAPRQCPYCGADLKARPGRSNR